MPIEGIDVHDQKGIVDWQHVAKAGKSFAFIRAAYGDRADTMVAQNFPKAKAEGLVRGLYHFYRVTRDPKKQADIMVATMKNVGFGPGDLPPVIDVEDNPKFDGVWDPTNNTVFILGIRDWIERIRREFKCASIVYTRASFWTLIGEPSGFNTLPLWVAHYKNAQGSPATPKLPKGWTDYAFWQYSENGQSDGVLGNCDMDVFNGTLAQLKALTI